MAVDNEPEIFWAGGEEQENAAISEWKRLVGYQPEWGQISAAGRFNGSSGLWVNQRVFVPLGKSRQDSWLTDCLDTYRCSKGLSTYLQKTYSYLRNTNGWPQANHSPHPDENAIVVEAITNHKNRLLSELTAAHPTLVITLGNAALRVFRHLLLEDSAGLPNKLSHLPHLYGVEFTVNLTRTQ
jgi:hypothetical protein